MKRRFLKRWVEVLLVVVNFICVLVMMCDVVDFKTFLTTHLLAMVIFSVNSYIFYSYSRMVQNG